jgi:hypothetical protein
VKSIGILQSISPLSILQLLQQVSSPGHTTMQTFDNGALWTLVSAAVTVTIAYSIYSVIYNVYFHPLAKFPGPPVARITIYWKAYIECILNRSFCHALVDLHAQYGKIA